jgi:hypothetical protein
VQRSPRPRGRSATRRRSTISSFCAPEGQRSSSTGAAQPTEACTLLCPSGAKHHKNDPVPRVARRSKPRRSTRSDIPSPRWGEERQPLGETDPPPLSSGPNGAEECSYGCSAARVLAGAAQPVEVARVLLPAPEGQRSTSTIAARPICIPLDDTDPSPPSLFPFTIPYCPTRHLCARRHFSSPRPSHSTTPTKPAPASSFPPSHSRLPPKRRDASVRTEASAGG